MIDDIQYQKLWFDLANESWFDVNMPLAIKNHGTTVRMFHPYLESSAVPIRGNLNGTRTQTTVCESKALAIKLAGLILNGSWKNTVPLGAPQVMLLKTFDLQDPVTGMLENWVIWIVGELLRIIPAFNSQSVV